MMTKLKRKTFKKTFNYKPGEVPGSYHHAQHIENKPVIELHIYNEQHYEHKLISSYKDLKNELTVKEFKYWVDIKGLGDLKLFDFFKESFHIHPLVLEDISKNHERSKLEEYEQFIFIVSRMLYFDTEMDLVNEQLSMIQNENTLFTFQQLPVDCLEPVRKRLQTAKGFVRSMPISYLTYAVVDVVIDNYFAILNKWNNDLDDLEEQIYTSLNKEIMNRAQLIRRNIVTIKRAAWAERDKVNDMIRSDSLLIHPEVKNYLKDAYDHCIQIMEMVESLKDIAVSILEVYLSMVSNRMNEIMKFLTIMSSLFIPLTFIAGIYGMNFAREDSHTGAVFSMNMPELYSPHGYVYVMIVMFVIVVLQIIYFWRKGWFK